MNLLRVIKEHPKLCKRNGVEERAIYTYFCPLISFYNISELLLEDSACEAMDNQKTKYKKAWTFLSIPQHVHLAVFQGKGKCGMLVSWAYHELIYLFLFIDTEKHTWLQNTDAMIIIQQLSIFVHCPRHNNVIVYQITFFSIIWKLVLSAN